MGQRDSMDELAIRCSGYLDLIILWAYCLCSINTFICLPWACHISLCTFAHDYVTYRTFMYWRIILGEHMNHNPIFSIRITFQQLLHTLYFQFCFIPKVQKYYFPSYLFILLWNCWKYALETIILYYYISVFIIKSLYFML